MGDSSSLEILCNAQGGLSIEHRARSPYSDTDTPDRHYLTGTRSAVAGSESTRDCLSNELGTVCISCAYL